MTRATVLHYGWRAGAAGWRADDKIRCAPLNRGRACGWMPLALSGSRSDARTLALVMSGLSAVSFALYTPGSKGRGRPPLYVEKGSTTDTPVRRKSSTFRVTRVSPCTSAVAANKPSMRGNGLGMPRTAHASAIGSSTGSTRSPRRHLPEPAVQRAGSLRITSALHLDTATYLCQNDDACSDLLGRRSRDPSGHVWGRSVALAKLGNDARIEQKPHSFSFRQSRSRGWSNTPAKPSSGRSEPNISNAVISAGFINAFSSADRRALALSGSPRSVSTTVRTSPTSFLCA